MATHKDRVKDFSKKYAQLSGAAISRLDVVFDDVYALAASRMERQLGSSGYGDYVALAVDDAYSSDTEYSSLTQGLRKLRSLESAEAYYILYFFVLSLKELQNKTVLVDSKEYGEGSLQPSEVESLITMRSEYLSMGDRLCYQFGSTGPVNMGSV